jgi:small subunit ribosomal protein S1
MSKLQEKIELYTSEVEKLGLGLDINLLASVAKGLGPSIYKDDAEKVSSSDKKELETVRSNYLIKKLGLEDNEQLDAAIETAIEKIGSSNRNKYRAIFYTILVEELNMQSFYLKDNEKETPVAEAVKEEVPVAVEEVKEETPVVEEVKEETPVAVEDVKEETPVAVEEVKEETPVAFEEVKEETPVIEATKEETPVAAEEVKEEKKKVSPEEFLDNFNWHKYEEGIEAVDEENIKAFEAALEGTLGLVSEREVIDGTVIRKTDREAIIDINSKSEGVISLNEFRYNPSLAVGDIVEVLVDKREDSTGQLVLSHKKARVIKAWDRVNNAHETGEVVNGFVKCRTRGGMIVDVFGIEAFLPGSQIDVKPIRDYDQYVEKTMEFKVVKINHEFKNVVVSHKALIEADIEIQKKEIIGKLEKGQVLEGVVKNITSYGVFVDLGGVDGLVHITDLSWSRINHPSEVVELDQTLNVVILDFDDEKTRIQLGLKQLNAHPWEALDESIKVGDSVKGKVVVLADYGAFIEVAQGVEGLIHVSEMSWSTHLRSAQDFVSVGDVVEAQVLTLDREERKMSLGIKQLHPDPWNNIAEKFPVGSTHTGTVRNYTNFGVFVELEEGIDGLVYISDLSWTKKIKHPSDFVSVGDKLEVKVLELDIEGRKLNLGHKQTTENPWDTHEATYAINSVHEGHVKEKSDKGLIVSFSDGVDAFVPGRFTTKEDGTKLAKGDTDKFKVIEFNKEFRRVVASHTSIFKAQEEKNIKTAQKKAELAEKTTLGDIGNDLAALKKKMEGK